MKRGLGLLIGVAALAMTSVGGTAAAGGRSQSARAAMSEHASATLPGAVIAGRSKHSKCNPAWSYKCAHGLGQGGTPPGCDFATGLSDELSGAAALRSVQPPLPDPVAGTVVIGLFATPGGTVTPPAGWKAVPLNGSSTDSLGLQVFYTIPIPLSNPGKAAPNSWSFTSSNPQATHFKLVSFDGLSQSNPVGTAGVQAGTAPSDAVAAPSITPSTANSLLLFFGATSQAESWTAPSGMTEVDTPPVVGSHSIEAAYQSWGMAAATGTRAATLSGPAQSSGALLALNVPGPTGCPQVEVLNRQGGVTAPNRRVLLTVGSNHRVPVALKCAWSEPCDGSVSFAPKPVGDVFAGSNFVIPAGGRRSVSVPVCAVGTTCRAVGGEPIKLRRSQGVQLVTEVLRPNGQIETRILNAELAFP